MKKIDTLVEDIYNLFSPDPVSMPEEEIDNHINTFGDMIKVHIKEFMCGEPKVMGNLRLSAIGKPDRQLWYNANSKQLDTPIKPSTKIKFLYGYILEELLLLCSSIAGHEVTDQQKEVELEGVKGHQDSLIDGVLVDCKSASGPGFQKFKNNLLAYEDPFGYIAQISAYAEANGLDEAAFLAIDKSTGEICLSRVHSMEMINARDRVKYLKDLVQQSITPSRCYEAVPDGKSGNHKLAVGCVYCSYKKDCWADLNNGNGLRVFQYARGKRFLTHVAKEPDVPEVFNW